MSMNNQLHRVQASILNTLRHTPDARFGVLMKPTGLQSDTFKFHLRKLVRFDYVEKLETGTYRLTAKGKEFANNIDETKRTAQHQPKLSILLIVPRPHSKDKPEFLFQKRKRNPYFGFWSCISGPIQWGEEAEIAAAHELKKQTGLTAACEVRAFYRKRDYDTMSQLILEDTLFIILEATKVSGTLSNFWHGGHNEWMTLDEFTQQPKHFTSVCEAVDILKTGKTYISKERHYTAEEY